MIIQSERLELCVLRAAQTRELTNDITALARAGFEKYTTVGESTWWRAQADKH